MLLAGRFELIERVGVGGSASVYRGADLENGDQVAVKVLHASLLDEPEIRERFDAEARLMTALDHPSIPALRARCQSDDTVAWFAIEFVEGLTLSRAATTGLSARTLAELGMEICSALGYLHDRGLVHRDVKPENILIDADGCARLIDFGIARNEAARLTIHGDIMGTPGFMPPEQALDTREATPASDVYSMGVSLFAAATRRSGIELTFTTTRQAALAELPVPLRGVIGRATERVVSKRFQNASDMEWALAEAMERL